MKLFKSIVLIIACIMLAGFSPELYAQEKGKSSDNDSYGHWRKVPYYRTYRYLYGPDGYYARLRTDMDCREKYDERDYRYYRWNRKYAYPVYMRARYAEDRCGRPYLYFPERKPE